MALGGLATSDWMSRRSMSTARSGRRRRQTGQMWFQVAHRRFSDRGEEVSAVLAGRRRSTQRLEVQPARELVEIVGVVQFLPGRRALHEREDLLEDRTEFLSEELGVVQRITVELGEHLEVLAVDDEDAREVHDLRLRESRVERRLDLLGEHVREVPQAILGVLILLERGGEIEGDGHDCVLQRARRAFRDEGP